MSTLHGVLPVLMIFSEPLIRVTEDTEAVDDRDTLCERLPRC